MAEAIDRSGNAAQHARELLAQLSLDEKIGQLVQVNGEGGTVPDWLRQRIAAGGVGSVINEVDADTVAELQRIAREESPHGIPLLIGRDVIHGFQTTLPIPLGLAATWHPELVTRGAALSAREAAGRGVNWTFSPMLDISRDPRWGRIAESFGEDPHLTGRMGAAMVEGYQSDPEHGLVACLKHFVGYGACESGRDYAGTYIPEVELRNVYLPPFRDGLDAGAVSIMPSFSDLNGMPPTANRWLLREVLRDEWQFEGLVVSDWASIPELITHGVAGDEVDAARLAAAAGVNMDMVSDVYARQLAGLVSADVIPEAVLDELVLEVLKVKVAAGLFDEPSAALPLVSDLNAQQIALQSAEESLVLLKNEGELLPLAGGTRVCLLGPMADQPYEQLGTWNFDGDEALSVPLRAALESRLGENLTFAPVLETTRTHVLADEASTLQLMRDADVIVVAVGEEAILSGEAHCRTDIELPGAQAALLELAAGAGKPIVAVVMAGRPLALASVIGHVDALIYAWHPGCMGGPAIANVLFGDTVPVGKLPVSLPRATGQIPVHYNHGTTGRPPTPETVVHIDDIDPRAPQTSIGNTSFHLDVPPSPLFPFGFGLSYTRFEYSDLEITGPMGRPEETLDVRVTVTNIGERAGTEIVQLYVRDVVARITRPVRELKGFQRIDLAPGASCEVNFSLGWQDLAYFNGTDTDLEPGLMRIWVGGDSDAALVAETLILSDA